MTRTTQDNKKIYDISIGKNAQNITYPFFGDDNLIFCKDQEKVAKNLIIILNTYQGSK